MKSALRILGSFILTIAAVGAASDATAQDQAMTPGDAAKGQVFFQQYCAVCHTTALGPGNTVLVKQGPSLVGIIGRKAGTGLGFNSYTRAMTSSGITWDADGLDRFLAGPTKMVPGTTMPIPVADAGNRRNLVAYLSTLVIPAGVTPVAAVVETSGAATNDPADWHNAAPGVRHHITVADLPPPFSTVSSGNGPRVVRPPTNAMLSVPKGFAVKLFASGLDGPRLMRTAPNGDIFIAETRANRIRVMRTTDGADAPAQNEIFAEGLDRPFGIAFYPQDNPQWIYVGNNNSVVRLPYKSGDLKASGPAETIVPKLSDTTGGHTTRDVAFSRDGKRMFISVGSGSNVGESMSKKSPAEIQAWEAEHGRGASWDSETARADVLTTDPEGKAPLRAFATGIRNGVGLAVNPETGDLWVSTNERDALGDNLVPDYVSRVKEGGYYGWPWYYTGNHEDPRHAGERPDLAGVAIVPDVLLQAHSASLEMTFYTATSGPSAFPAEYRGDVFAALHGSWNRSARTGYKVVRARLDHGVPTGEYDDFLTGFVVDNRSVWGRPVGVTVAHDGALLVTEDGNGTMWRVSYFTGE